MKPQDSDNEQIAGLIKSLNLAWREKQFERLDPLFAETVVLQDSEGRRLVDGKTACIQSYRDFMEICPRVSLRGGRTRYYSPFRICHRKLRLANPIRDERH